MPETPGTPETATQRRRRIVRVAEEAAADYDGISSREQLRQRGLTKGHVRTQVRAGRGSSTSPACAASGHFLRPRDRWSKRGARGRVYLDASWDRYRLVVEIEGIHHGVASTQIADALRQNSLSLRRDAVLRSPLLGPRVAPEECMGQVAEALADAGAA
jgi:hypothetical protein